MYWLILLPVRLYRMVPSRFKRRCLFKESCSVFFLRVIAEHGFWAGLRLIRRRLSQCRPKYVVHYNYLSQDWEVKLADGSVVESKDISDFVLKPYQGILAKTLEHQRSISNNASLHL